MKGNLEEYVFILKALKFLEEVKTQGHTYTKIVKM